MLDSRIKVLALLVTISGALLTAFQLVPYNIYLGNLGSLLYATWAYRARDYNIALVNTGLLIIYAIGLVYHYNRDIVSKIVDCVVG